MGAQVGFCALDSSQNYFFPEAVAHSLKNITYAFSCTKPIFFEWAELLSTFNNSVWLLCLAHQFTMLPIFVSSENFIKSVFFQIYFQRTEGNCDYHWLVKVLRESYEKLEWCCLGCFIFLFKMDWKALYHSFEIKNISTCFFINTILLNIAAIFLQVWLKHNA